MWERTDVRTFKICLQQRSSKVTWNYTWNLTLKRWIGLEVNHCVVCIHDYLQCSKQLWRSLKRILEKKRGPRTPPWGTPTRTFCWGDWQFSTHVTWYRLSRYEANHFTTWELATMTFRFSTRSTWSTASKALERSDKTAPVKPPLSRVCILNLLLVDPLAIGASFFRPIDRRSRERSALRSAPY